MSSDIERFASELPSARQHRGYPQPSWWSNPGQVDRRNEADHVERMRQLYRDAEYEVAERDKELLEIVKQLDVRCRAASEAKFALHRARKESQILNADDDPELAAKFALLDDDNFGKIRMALFEWD